MTASSRSHLPIQISSSARFSWSDVRSLSSNLSESSSHRFCKTSGRSRSSASERVQQAFGSQATAISYLPPIEAPQEQINDLPIKRIARSVSQKIARGAVRIGQKVKGALSKTDGQDRDRDSYADDYVLRGVRVGQVVDVSLRARFDGNLQLINARTGRELLYGEDTLSPNPRLVFRVKQGMKYLVRVTSARSNKTGNYTLRSKRILTQAPNFDFFSGYGLVNAAAAVAQAKGVNLFADVPNLVNDHWGLDIANVPEVWAQGITGQGVTVAVIDSGVDYNHPDLQGSLWQNAGEIPNNGIDDDGNGYVDDWRGWNFVNNTNDPADDAYDGHGTHVSGIIGAARNTIGATGVAYGANVMPLKVLNADGVVKADLVIANAIRYAVQNGAKVISMSLGGNPGLGVQPELEDALRFAHASGVVVVSAAGNERQMLGSLKSGDPAFFTAVRDLGIAVGAINSNRRIDIDSNPAGRVPIPYVVAPGVNVRSTVPGADYTSYSGTSMATPFVAGIAALMLSANPNLTPNQVANSLIATTDRQGIRSSP